MTIAVKEPPVAVSTAGGQTSVLDFLASQPNAGDLIIACLGAFFAGQANEFSLQNPLNLFTQVDGDNVSGEVGGIVADQTATGSENNTVSGLKSGTGRSLALGAIVLTGAGPLQTKGLSNPTPDGTSITVTSEQVVAEDGSRAVFFLLRRSRNEGGSMAYTYSNGFVEEGKAQKLSDDSHTEIYIATATVNSGGLASCTWDTSDGTTAGIEAFLLVYPPLAGPGGNGPTLSDPGTINTAIGFPEPIGTSVQAADADGDLATLRYQCTVSRGQITVTLSGAAAISSGVNGSNDLTVSGSHADVLATHASAVYVPLILGTDAAVTITGTDALAASFARTFSIIAHTVVVENNNQVGLNASITSFLATPTSTGTSTLSLTAVDSGGRTNTKVSTITAGLDVGGPWLTWARNPATVITYEHPVIDVGAIVPFVPLISVEASGAASIFEAHSDDGVIFSQFAPISGQIIARYFKVFVTVSGTFPRITEVSGILDAKIDKEYINNLIMSNLQGTGVGDRRIPISKPFQVITAVNLVMQNVGPGFTWDIVDYNVGIGPRIRTYNASATLVDVPLIDVTVEGILAA